MRLLLLTAVVITCHVIIANGDDSESWNMNCIRVYGKTRCSNGDPHKKGDGNRVKNVKSGKRNRKGTKAFLANESCDKKPNTERNKKGQQSRKLKPQPEPVETNSAVKIFINTLAQAGTQKILDMMKNKPVESTTVSSQLTTYNSAEPKPAAQELSTLSPTKSTLLISSFQSNETNYDSPKNALRAVVKSLNRFSTHFYKLVARTNFDNFVCTPSSIFLALSMIAYGTGGNTQQQLHNVLALPVNDTLAKIGYQSLVEKLENIPTIDFRLANKIYVANSVQLNADFILTTKSIFRTTVENLDFSDSNTLVKIVNKWLVTETNHHMKDVIKPSDLDQNANFLLANAVEFSGLWDIEFDGTDTSNRVFYVNGTSPREILTMYSFGLYSYGEFANAKYIELPFQDSSTSMFILLPNNNTILNELEQQFGDATLSENLFQGTLQKVHLFLPRYKIESHLAVNEPLIAMGLNDMFGPTANFIGISNDPKLKIAKVAQKAFIEISEKGAMPPAGRWNDYDQYAPQVPYKRPGIEFTVDRPFISIIVSKINNVLLLVSRYTGSV